MPFSHKIFPSRELVLAVGRGVVSYADVRALLDGLLADPALKPGFRRLLDCTGVVSVTLTPLELRSLAGRARIKAERLGDGRVAVVAPAHHVFGVARMYEAFSEDLPRPFRVFREMEPAMKWLEAPTGLWEPESFLGSARAPAQERDSRAS